MNDVECPECGHEHDIKIDGWSDVQEDNIYDNTCPSCNKIYCYSFSVVRNYEAHKADCQNGSDHDWKPMKIYPLHWPDARYCRDCGLEDRGKFVELEYERGKS